MRMRSLEIECGDKYKKKEQWNALQMPKLFMVVNAQDRMRAEIAGLLRQPKLNHILWNRKYKLRVLQIHI